MDGAPFFRAWVGERGSSRVDEFEKQWGGLLRGLKPAPPSVGLCGAKAIVRCHGPKSNRRSFGFAYPMFIYRTWGPDSPQRRGPVAGGPDERAPLRMTPLVGGGSWCPRSQVRDGIRGPKRGTWGTLFSCWVEGARLRECTG
jgi:hypothetical protein